MAAAQFDKDFGYLMPFLDKVAEAAKGLADAGSREELTRLMAEEKARWARIRQLLAASGVARSSPPERPKSVAARVPQTAPPASAADDRPAREPFSFTVGSLRKRQ